MEELTPFFQRRELQTLTTEAVIPAKFAGRGTWYNTSDISSLYLTVTPSRAVELQSYRREENISRVEHIRKTIQTNQRMSDTFSLSPRLVSGNEELQS